MVSDPAVVNWADEESGTTPLMEAAAAGRFDLVESLISRGASMDAQEKETGFTPLMSALQNRY